MEPSRFFDGLPPAATYYTGLLLKERLFRPTLSPTPHAPERQLDHRELLQCSAAIRSDAIWLNLSPGESWDDQDNRGPDHAETGE